MLEELKSNWQSLLYEFQVEPKLGHQIFFELVNAYSSDGRYYHNLNHIQRVLKTVERMKPLAHNLPVIQLVAWFHDVIYNPNARDNEEKSADYTANILTQFQIANSTINAVTQMILNTKHHQAVKDDKDSQIFLDADLAILGADDWDYRVYTQEIRQEYSGFSSEDYRRGRIEVLQKLLQRERIYFTNWMFEELEGKARQNMQREIKVLSKSVGN